jgi:hypothetical protein
MLNADDYVGTLWRLTCEVICLVAQQGGGNHKHQIFAVADVTSDGFLLAWRCHKKDNGRIAHPAYRWPLSQKDHRLFVKRGPTGTEPSFRFRPNDAFYTKIKN